jgi:hypothetical protein
MSSNRFDKRLQLIPNAWATAAEEVIDTADIVLLQLQDWIDEKMIPGYDPGLHAALTRLIVERHLALTTPIEYPGNPVQD